jgi:hypothetical protein
MSIPNVNMQVLDGALGIIPASVANLGVKLGVCTLGQPSVAASKLLGSTTPPDGVTFTAVTPGVGGNLISVTYNAPAGGATTVVVTGNDIVVSPKAGALNSDIVTAIQASTPASALVTVAATVGGDAVVAVAKTFLAGGITATVYSETNPTQAIADLGAGPLAESVVQQLNVAGGQVLAVAVNPSVAGANSAVAKAGANGTGVLTVTGSPVDGYQVQVVPTQSGLAGAGAFKYSLDGGRTFSAEYANSATFAIPGTGLTLHFGANIFAVGDVYSFTSTAPGFALADLVAALNALFASPQLWGFLHVVGQASSLSGAAAIAAALESQLVALAANKYRYVHGIVEVPTDSDANIQSAFAGQVYTRVMVCPGNENTVSGITGQQLLRSSAWSASARTALVQPAEDLGRVKSGSLPGVTAIDRDEAVTPALDALDFTTLRTIIGRPGFFITSGHMFVAPTSDYSLSQNRRVMDLACAIARDALLNFLNDTIQVNPSTSAQNPGSITNRNASFIENAVNSALAQGLGSNAISASIVIDRTNNVLSTKTINYQVRVVPNGYAKQITGNIGFLNPALQIQAAS